MLDTNKPLVELALVIGAFFALGQVSLTAQTTQPCQWSPNPWSPCSAASYDDLVNDLEGGRIPSGDADLTAVRMKYAASADYDPEEGAAQIPEMYQKLDEKKYEGALKIANDVLAKQYVNIDAHMVAARAYEGLHDDGRAKLHLVIAMFLVRSVFRSAGDGTNPSCHYSYGPSCGTSIADTLKVIPKQEEDAVARAAGLRPVKQSAFHEGGRSYDRVEFINTHDNSAVTLYFDAAFVEQHTQRTHS